jgi:hypothetical protein
MISQRTIGGLAAAKARGRKLGSFRQRLPQPRPSSALAADTREASEVLFLAN